MKVSAATLAPPAAPDRLLRAFPPKPMTVTGASNASLLAADGRRYTDLGGASQGAAVVGHNHPAIVRALRFQADRVMHVAQAIPNDARTTFLDRLHALLPEPLARTFLANSGTEGIECALKLAVAATGRRSFVACQGAFHGRTAGALSLTHRHAFRAPFAPLLADVQHVPFNDEEALQAAITHETAAFVVEPVQGEGGVRAASNAFLRAARDRCDDTGAVLVFDEVQSAMRTGTFLAAEPSGVIPDAVVLGKGLAGGLPIGACSISDALADALPRGGHGSTYGGSPLVCAAGTATLDVLVQEQLMERAAVLGTRFLSRLGRPHPLVRECQGRGLMAGVTLRVRPHAVLAALQEMGVLALPAGSTQVRFLPPLTIPAEQLDAAANDFRTALEA